MNELNQTRTPYSFLEGHRIQVDRLELNTMQAFKVSGDETWLNTIYSEFLLGKSEEAAKLVADLSVERQDLVVRLVGQFFFKPSLACSRCAEPFLLELSKSLDLYFSFKVEESPSDCDLSESQLDEYVIVDDQIDLELILNEAVQLEIPSAAKCGDCETADMISGGSEPLVYSSGDVSLDTHRPFAKLGKITVSKH